ncbi:hypothetical protein [Anthocerotibacter panamensis]|uniref:hypothetical protein n=1 Tax=Anthocerotibacter panamensis TaxID=2857077 RepID=UPI001C40367F|nr:hypothetical protein [Anthocerotibacter panamensis]
MHRTSLLAQEGGLRYQLGEDCFQRAKVLADQVACLLEMADITETQEQAQQWSQTIAPQLHPLQQEQRHWVQEGIRLQEEATHLLALGDNYAKVVIELHVCLVKVNNLPAAERAQTAVALLQAFQERCGQLEEAYRQLRQPQVPSQEPVQPSPPASTAASPERASRISLFPG